MDFDPQIGYEQKGRRPALVISNNIFSKFSNLTIVCPITNTAKDHPFYVKLNGTKTTGTILCTQIKALDVIARNFQFIETIPNDILFEVIDIVKGFIEI